VVSAVIDGNISDNAGDVVPGWESARRVGLGAEVFARMLSDASRLALGFLRYMGAFHWQIRAEHGIMLGHQSHFNAARAVARSVSALVKEVDAA